MGRGRSKPQTVVSAIYTALRILAVVAPLGGWTGLVVMVALSNVAYFAIGLVNAKLTLGWPASASLAAISAPALAALGSAGLIAWLQMLAPAGLAAFVGLGVLGGLVYLGLLAALDFANLRRDLERALRMVAPRSRFAG
jgi:hypothetical protein